jgi:hypothetical protein
MPDQHTDKHVICPGPTQGAAKGDLAGTGLAIAGFIPGLGQAAAVGEMANDWNTGMEESPECQ